LTFNHYILASQSPRRFEILKKHNIYPSVMPVDVDETLPPGIRVRDAVMFLALKKAAAACSELQKNRVSDRNRASDSDALIIAADTVVYTDSSGILGKPVDEQDAFAMLSSYRNTFHYVATGCALFPAAGPPRRVFCEVTKVFCKNYSDKDIRDYIASGEPFDKAGAYAIQGSFRKHIDHIEGDYENVVGLPFNRLHNEILLLEREYFQRRQVHQSH